MASSTRSKVLSLYKEIIRYSREAKAPTGQPNYRQQAQEEFRKNVNETDPQKIDSLIKKAESKLGFLKIVAPRLRSRQSTDGGKSTFIFREGTGLIEKDNIAQRKTTFRDDRIDPDDLARHKRLLDRQHFRGRHMPLRWGER